MSNRLFIYLFFSNNFLLRFSIKYIEDEPKRQKKKQKNKKKKQDTNHPPPP